MPEETLTLLKNKLYTQKKPDQSNTDRTDRNLTMDDIDKIITEKCTEQATYPQISLS